MSHFLQPLPQQCFQSFLGNSLRSFVIWVRPSGRSWLSGTTCPGATLRKRAGAGTEIVERAGSAGRPASVTDAPPVAHEVDVSGVDVAGRRSGQGRQPAMGGHG